MKIVPILIKKIPPVNRGVLVDLKNIESPVMPFFMFFQMPIMKLTSFI
jgi:hypothetical protein